MYYTHRCQIESSTHFEATLHMRQLVLQGRDSRIQRFGCCSIFLFEAVLNSVHSTYVQFVESIRAHGIQRLTREGLH